MTTHKTPFEEIVEGQIKNLEKTAKMEKGLRKYGKKIPGGHVWTVGDLCNFLTVAKTIDE